MVKHATTTGGVVKKLICDGSGNLQTNVINAVYTIPHNSVNAELTPTNSINVKTLATYENETAVATGLNVYGANNGTSIDMNGYRNIVIKVRSTATTALSPLQNLRIYYDLEYLFSYQNFLSKVDRVVNNQGFLCHF